MLENITSRPFAWDPKFSNQNCESTHNLQVFLCCFCLTALRTTILWALLKRFELQRSNPECHPRHLVVEVELVSEFPPSRPRRQRHLWSVLEPLNSPRLRRPILVMVLKSGSVSWSRSSPIGGKPQGSHSGRIFSTWTGVIVINIFHFLRESEILHTLMIPLIRESLGGIL